MSFNTIKYYGYLNHCHGLWRPTVTWFTLALKTFLKTCLPRVNLRQINLLRCYIHPKRTDRSVYTIHALSFRCILTISHLLRMRRNGGKMLALHRYVRGPPATDGQGATFASQENKWPINYYQWQRRWLQPRSVALEISRSTLSDTRATDECVCGGRQTRSPI